MIFNVETKLNDGLADAPAVSVHAPSIDELLFVLGSDGTFENDYGIPIPPGATVTIERVS